ncbi:MAG: phosphate butyryltransferase [Prevotellaceae bacterium]|jgi:phosphate butyryltransferase|nr:phosphate butyryltransferase [Prevotellaceae bacterium]
MITSFEEIYAIVASLPKKRLVVAWGVDDHSIVAAAEAIKRNLADVTLVGNQKMIRKACDAEKIDSSIFHVIDISDDVSAVNMAVSLINSGEGDMLMKGLCSTDKYMRAILNKEKGLLPPKTVLSHVSLLFHPEYHKLILMSDIAVIPAPDLSQKIAMVGYLVDIARKLGIEKPKVAALAATEQMLTGMQACVDAAMLAKMAERGQIRNCILDGPLSLDIAVSKEAARIKKVNSEVAGDADCLLFPNIESGNMFYKANSILCKGTRLAAIVTGAKAPAVLSSRGDNTDTKLNSIALAALMAKPF